MKIFIKYRTNHSWGSTKWEYTDLEVDKDKKAEKWKKVEEIAGRNWLDEYPCEGCSVEDMCDSSLSLCGDADSIVTALEGEGEKG